MDWLFLVALGLLISTCSGSSRPNVLLLLADDLGYGDLSSSGHPTSSSPNLDLLLQNSRLFTQFYSSACVCSPSRAALLTGRYQVRSGVYPGVFEPGDIGGLPASEVTLAEALRTRGYLTSHIGKWHLGVGANQEYLPTNFGFDHYFGIPYSHDMCPCRVCFYPKDPCFDRCRTDDVSCPLFHNQTIVAQPVDLTTLTQRYTEEALSFMDAAHRSSQPFFLYFAFHQTHHPQFASSAFRNSTRRGTFGDSLAEMDYAIGRLLDALRHMGVLNDTIIWFTSDNGPSLTRQERGGSAGLLRCGKGTTYEGGVRVPAMVSWTNHINPARTEEIASTLDVFPTILSLVDQGSCTSKDNPLDGLDLSGLLLRNKPSPRTSFIYYPMSPKPSQGIFAVRYKQYKAHFYTAGNSLSDGGNYDEACTTKEEVPKSHNPPLLFDLEKDPGERIPLKTQEFSEVLNKIRQIKKNAEKSIKWAPSEMSKGSSPDAMPCCTKKGCKPFPTCCDCPQGNHENNDIQDT